MRLDIKMNYFAKGFCMYMVIWIFIRDNVKRILESLNEREKQK